MSFCPVFFLLFSLLEDGTNILLDTISENLVKYDFRNSLKLNIAYNNRQKYKDFQK